MAARPPADGALIVPELWVAVVLGIVEGITEFLPVSSTGHLILAGRLLPSLGEREEAFTVVIQSGALLAVLWLFRARFVALLRPAPRPGAFGGLRGLGLLALACAPVCAVGFLARHLIHDLHTPAWVASALVVGGFALLLLERTRGDRGTRLVDDLTPALAFGVGLFQCLALWPGVSRSAATIVGGMLLGLTRRAAAELSFLAAVPVLLLATAYELVKDRHILEGQNATFLAVGFATSAVAAVLAVKAFIAFVGRSTMVPFAWYRIALGAAVAALLVVGV